jgi:hypothetical protein
MKRGSHPNSHQQSRSNSQSAVTLHGVAAFLLRCLRLFDIADMLVVRLDHVARNIVSHGFWKNV